VPRVMGILNLTPDSFYDGGKAGSIGDQVEKVGSMLANGASVIDLGAVSTRPGSHEICEDCEIERLIPSLRAIRYHFPEAIISVDTFRPEVAREAVYHGADMINDIYGGTYAPEMAQVIAELRVPCILMHIKGNPATMQQQPEYGDVVAEIAFFLEKQTEKYRELGVRQLLIDPGIGFGKTILHNFEILRRLPELVNLGYPLVIGLSRKSLIRDTLHIDAEKALNGTTVLNTIALLNGANIIRVHDVSEAKEVIDLVSAYQGENCLPLHSQPEA